MTTRVRGHAVTFTIWLSDEHKDALIRSMIEQGMDVQRAQLRLWQKRELAAMARDALIEALDELVQEYAQNDGVI